MVPLVKRVGSCGWDETPGARVHMTAPTTSITSNHIEHDLTQQLIFIIMIVFRSKQWVLDRIVVEMSLYGFDRFKKARIGCPDVGSIAVTSGSAIL